jgi:hypothetical protein
VLVDVPEIRLARNIFALRPHAAADSATRLFLDLVAEQLAALPVRAARAGRGTADR